MSAIGSGMTAPLLIIYLHSVRGFDLGLATVVGGTAALASIAGNPLGGVFADKIGARNTAVIGLVLAAAGTASIGFLGQLWQIFVVIGVIGLGVSISLPAQDTLLAASTSSIHRSKLFAMRYLGFNLGLGLGGLSTTLMINVDQPKTFIAAYLCDAATFLAAVALLARVRENSPPKVHAGFGWKHIVPRDKNLLRLCLLKIVFALIGYGQLRVAFAGWIEYNSAPARLMGMVYLANTLTVVVAQLPVLRVVARRRRTHALAGAAAVWALTWLVMLASGHYGHAALLLPLAACLLAVGETLLAVSLPAIVNDIAVEDMRGRYNGSFILAGTIGMIGAPVITGSLLQFGHPDLLMILLSGAALVAIVPCLRLGRRLPVAANRFSGLAESS